MCKIHLKQKVQLIYLHCNCAHKPHHISGRRGIVVVEPRHRRWKVSVRFLRVKMLGFGVCGDDGLGCEVDYMCETASGSEDQGSRRSQSYSSSRTVHDFLFLNTACWCGARCAMRIRSSSYRCSTRYHKLLSRSARVSAAVGAAPSVRNTHERW
jgi:hypothetical protein